MRAAGRGSRRRRCWVQIQKLQGAYQRFAAFALMGGVFRHAAPIWSGLCAGGGCAPQVATGARRLKALGKWQAPREGVGGRGQLEGPSAILIARVCTISAVMAAAIIAALHSSLGVHMDNFKTVRPCGRMRQPQTQERAPAITPTALGRNSVLARQQKGGQGMVIPQQIRYTAAAAERLRTRDMSLTYPVAVAVLLRAAALLTST